LTFGVCFPKESRFGIVWLVFYTAIESLIELARNRKPTFSNSFKKRFESKIDPTTGEVVNCLKPEEVKKVVRF
jgi:hypothetical protein